MPFCWQVIGILLLATLQLFSRRVEEIFSERLQGPAGKNQWGFVVWGCEGLTGGCGQITNAIAYDSEQPSRGPCLLSMKSMQAC